MSAWADTFNRWRRAVEGTVRNAGRQRAHRSLRLRETLPLGERRFLAVVEFHGQELLVAGTPNSITLLGAANGEVAPVSNGAFSFVTPVSGNNTCPEKL
jgi:hypothetical protein